MHFIYLIHFYSDNRTKVAEILLQNKANPNNLDQDGSNALQTALHNGNSNVLLEKKIYNGILTPLG